jgi:nucleoid DNA-binding protein
MKSKRSKARIRQIAEQENLTLRQVEEIVNSPFKFVAKMMPKGDKYSIDFPQIRIFKFGVFHLKPGRKIKYEEFNRNKQRIADNLSGSSGDQGVQNDMGSGQVEEEGQGS